MDNLTIPSDLLEQIVTHCRLAYPEEACGLFALDGQRVVAAWPGTNILHSPVRYRMAGEEVARLMWTIEEERGLEAGAYHSHPHGPDALSPTDLAEIGCSHNLLVAHVTREQPVVRAFRVDGRRVTRISLRPEGAPPGPAAGYN
jgi:proteasome lid subunit RPN8/RPN11